jgi:hypothetical protein
VQGQGLPQPQQGPGIDFMKPFGRNLRILLHIITLHMYWALQYLKIQAYFSIALVQQIYRCRFLGGNLSKISG